MQSNSDNSNPLPQETHIGRIALRVSDLEAMKEFYRDIVGLNILRHSETTAILGVADTALLVLEGDKEARVRDESGTGLFHSAFRVPSRKALGDVLIRIQDGWQLDGASNHGVSEALYLTDPEGNGIEIYYDFPRDEWPRTDDDHVRMVTDPPDLPRIEAAAVGNVTLPAKTDIGHIHLEVSSLDAFESFYVDTLEFEMQMTIRGASFVSAGGYHHHIGANTWHHRSTPNNGRGLSWFEVVVPDRGTFDAVRARFIDRDIPVTEDDDGFVVRDPDEIEVRIRSHA